MYLRDTLPCRSAARPVAVTRTTYKVFDKLISAERQDSTVSYWQPTAWQDWHRRKG
jgi:hypothetical protein